MRRQDIVIESSGNLQVSRKQDTYYLQIKEDLRKKFISCWGFFSLRKTKKQQISLKIRVNLHSKS